MTRLILSIVLAAAFTGNTFASEFTGAMGKRNAVTTLEIVEEFIGGNGSTNQTGETGASVSNIALTAVTGEANHPGIRNESTGATINTINTVSLGNFGSVVQFIPSDFFDVIFIVRPQTSTVQEMRVGLTATTTLSPAANGIWFEQDTGSSDTTWWCVTRASSVNTRTNTSITVTAGTWYTMRIRRLSATQIEFILNGTSACTHTANIPTVVLVPGATIENLEAVNKNMDHDLWIVRVNGLSR